MLRLTHLQMAVGRRVASTVLTVNLRAPPRHCYHPFATIMKVKYVMKITAESTNENGTKHIKFISDIAEYKRIVTSNLAVLCCHAAVLAYSCTKFDST